jgi:hypothetical protein
MMETGLLPVAPMVAPLSHEDKHFLPSLEIEGKK